MSYNGWSNRETWLINVWFNPETWEDVDSAQAYFEEAYDAMPAFMQDFVNDGMINWDELREAVADNGEAED